MTGAGTVEAEADALTMAQQLSNSAERTSPGAPLVLIPAAVAAMVRALAIPGGRAA